MMSSQTKQPDLKKQRFEANPDLSLDISAVPAVQDLVRRNNAETRPKKRLRQMDFLNEAFYTLGRKATEVAVVADDVLTLFDEFTHTYKVTPRNTTLAKVFYAWQEAGLYREALNLLKKLLAAKDVVPTEVFQTSFDEKVATVTLRLVATVPVTNGTTGDAHLQRAQKKELVEAILAAAPEESLRRRVFTPLLSFARQEKDWGFAMHIITMALNREIELWDGDYHEILSTIALARDSGATEEETKDRVGTVLDIMASHQPVVGAENAALLHRLIGGSMDCTVSSAGECSRCKQTLASFDLTEEDRAALLRDIEEKLILPRVDGLSRYEPEKKVTEEEKLARLREYTAFKQKLSELDYDSVIDGANVGYYGLSSWYAGARREELLMQKRAASDNATVADEAASAPVVLSARDLASIPAHPPFPVDVPPKFTLIEGIREEAVREGKKPIIILHSRHTNHGTPGNMALLKSWQEKNSFLASPAFLNDDYCWLYAAVVRANTFIISNDQMRDHHFLMLSPRFFVRWRQRHRITYKAFYVHETGAAIPRIRLPRCYSVWVQRAVVGGLARWHIPYVSSIAILDQATNRTTKTGADVDLNKDGDDSCSAWVCTGPCAQ